MAGPQYVQAKTIVTKTKSSQWFGIDYNMNIYRGCSHGCIYCDSRSDCYQIEEFDQVKVKEDALRIIRDDLRRKVRTGVVGTGAMSDPYNPWERELNLTRHALELIDAFGFGAAIATKSTMLLRDVDILAGIREHSPVLLKVTITTADDVLAKKIEPGVPVSSKRFQMIAALRKENLFSGILLMPVLPFLEDEEKGILTLVKHAHDAGANFIYPAFGMTLRGNQREWYFQQLNRLFPGQGLVERYIRTYQNQYECRSPKAASLWKAFSGACEQYRILYQMKDIIHAYRKNYEITQLNIFDI
ncbi:MAG: radical SAM protein [Lachnospiraceae bacterium]